MFDFQVPYWRVRYLGWDLEERGRRQVIARVLSCRSGLYRLSGSPLGRWDAGKIRP